MDSRTAFSDSNDISNGSGISCLASNNTEIIHSPEVSASDPAIAALRLLSDNIESIFGTRDFDYFTDAKIVLEGGREVGVHRCILSARSPYFKVAFSTLRERGENGGGERGGAVKLQLKELARDFQVGFDSLVAVLTYLYSGKVKPFPACVCVDDECDHISCRPAVDFLVEVLYLCFTFQISELVGLYQRHLLEILNKIALDDLLVVLSVAWTCGNACERLYAKCIEIIVKSDIDIITLEKSLPQHIVKQIMDTWKDLGVWPEPDGFPDKHVKRLHRALDSDDVELVGMLLKEGHTSLDDAYALHYAVAYCDAKTTTELLDLGLADVNLTNKRGYTVLHVAAMRKEPKIIVSLLTKGARPTDVTPDGRKALQISKRLTTVIRSVQEGKASPKEQLCIEILEQAEGRDPLLGEASVSLAMAGDDLRMKLLYLENRVGLAKLLFPIEAKVAMDIAQVDGTSEFISKTMNDAQKTVDLNEAPFKIKEEHLRRFEALSKTVELGKRFFPRCSRVLNGIMDAEDLSELACLGNDSAEDRMKKRRRYEELQELFTQAFSEDQKEHEQSTVSSSSSSASMIKPYDKFTLER